MEGFDELESPDDLPAEQARAEKWKGVKKLVDDKLTDTATGRLFVFYALTVWT